MTFKLSYRGISETQEAMQELIERSETAISRTVNFVMASTGQRVKHKIREEGRSGKIYYLFGQTHQASAPGEPPANLTGELAASYHWTLLTDNLNSVADVGSDLDKARVLEFGGRNDDGQWVAPRPVLIPSFMEAVAKADEVLAREMRK